MALLLLVAAIGLGPVQRSIAAAPPSEAATASGASAAAAHYERAMAHRKAKRFIDAGRAFDAARAAEHSVVLLYNAGRMYQQAGELELARKRFRQFLAEERSPGDRRQKVVKLLAEVEKAIAAKASEKAAAERRLALLQQQRRAELRAVVADAEQLRTAGWATLVVGAAAGLTGVGFAVAYETAAAPLRNPDTDIDGRNTLTEKEALALAADAETFGTVGIVTGALGVALAVTGALLVVHAGETESEGRRRLQVTPSVSLGRQEAMFGARIRWE